MSRAPRVAAAVASSPAAKRCAIYTRKSTAVGSDVSLSSLDAQRDVCAAYVGTKRGEGWRALSERYDDGGYTGANLERPAFRRLMADIVAGKIDVVVVYKVDRLSRSLLDFATVIRLFEQHGVAFVSVTQSFSTADAIGRLVLNLLMSFAEFEREMIAERTRDKIAASRRRGKWTGGVAPFGYQTVDRKLLPDPATAPIAVRAFETYLEGRSIMAVLRLLDELAPRTTRKGAPRPWARNDVRRMLDNPIYAGLIRIPGEGVVRGEHPALIDRATFDLVTGRSRERRPSPKGADAYFLRGLVTCATCHASLTPATTRRNRNRFRYYRCARRDRHGAHACALSPVRAEDLERLVLEQLQCLVKKRAVGASVTDEVGRQLAATRAALGVERASLPEQFAEHTRQAEEIARTMTTADDRAAGELALTESLAAAAAVERRLLDVDAELRELERAQRDLAWIGETLANFELVWAALTVAERARLVELLLERIEVKPDRSVDLTWRSFASRKQ
ncbi:MAG: recombinase family protein [Kofleriaceae bacterium]|nr:MAG: recombinase family protein [Kofleriaceae bacterium]MBZ0234428.1 recombinase family protein [Kofleriaceae bacterium]